MVTAYIGLGSNIGNKAGNITKTIALLKSDKKIGITKIARLYKTSPVNVSGRQQDYLNTAIEVNTIYRPEKLLLKLKKIEKQLGRNKDSHNKPRIIDLDILFYGNTVFENKKLVIPHPEIQNRKFVLIPLLELNKEFIHPVYKKSIYRLYQKIKNIKNQKIQIYQ